MQSALRTERFLAVDPSLALDRLTPIGHDAPEVADRVDARGVDELRLRARERGGIRIPRGDKVPRGAHRDVTRLDGGAGVRHLIEGSRRAHLVARHSPRHLERGREPRRSREVPVPFEQMSPLDLTQPPERLQLELVDDAADLGEVLLDPGVGKVGERLAT